jgi:hypothetical protein
MKKHNKIIGVLLALCLSATLLACGGNDDENPVPPDGDAGAYTIALSVSALELPVYGRVTLTAAVTDSDGVAQPDVAVTWTSDKTAAVTVSDGRVFAVSQGTAKITASVGEARASCNVTATYTGIIPELELDKESISISAGGTIKIGASVSFNGAVTDDADTVYTFETANGGIASAAADGTVTGVGIGTTTITVTAAWRGLGGPQLTGSEDALGLRKTITIEIKAAA